VFAIAQGCDRPEADPSLIQNLASLSIIYDDFHIFVEVSSVHIDRDAPGAGGTLHKNEPALFVFSETQKIRFPIDLKIHFNPLPISINLSS
jgi:hypothetical protein